MENNRPTTPAESLKKMKKNKIIDFQVARRAKQDTRHTVVKPLAKMTPELIKSSMEFKRRAELRDE